MKQRRLAPVLEPEVMHCDSSLVGRRVGAVMPACRNFCEGRINVSSIAIKIKNA